MRFMPPVGSEPLGGRFRVRRETAPHAVGVALAIAFFALLGLYVSRNTTNWALDQTA
jgi:hypothetical protein